MDQEMDANLTITTAPTVQAATTHHSDYNIQFIPASIAAVSHSWIKHIPFTYKNYRIWLLAIPRHCIS